MREAGRLRGPAALLLALASSFSWAGAAGPCGPSETAYFACRTQAGKWIALCGALPNALQYRYGRPGKVELAYPEDAAEGKSRLLYAHYFRSRVERTEVSFSRAGADYAVFDYREDGQRRAGVRVAAPGIAEREFTCAGPVQSRLGELKDALGCDADNALNGGACP